MTHTVLIPYDGSEQANRALEHAIERFPDSRLVVISVINPSESVYAADGAVSPFPDNWYDTAREQTEEMLETAAERVEKAGHDIETVTEVGRPARAVVEYVEEHDVDHVVMGSHGRSGVSRLLLGSVAETVLRRSPVPITVIR